MNITLWTLTTDTDNGLQTSIHTSELDCYKRLIDCWFPSFDPEYEQDREAALMALEVSVKQASDWFDAYFEVDEGSGDIASIEPHDVEVAA